MAIIQKPVNDAGTLLKLSGGFTAVLGLVVGLLSLFVIPSGCIFVWVIEFAILSLLFIGGLVAFLLGLILSHRKARPN